MIQQRLTLSLSLSCVKLMQAEEEERQWAGNGPWLHAGLKVSVRVEGVQLDGVIAEIARDRSSGPLNNHCSPLLFSSRALSASALRSCSPPMLSAAALRRCSALMLSADALRCCSPLMLSPLLFFFSSGEHQVKIAYGESFGHIIPGSQIQSLSIRSKTWQSCMYPHGWADNREKVMMIKGRVRADVVPSVQQSLASHHRRCYSR